MSIYVQPEKELTSEDRLLAAWGPLVWRVGVAPLWADWWSMIANWGR